MISLSPEMKRTWSLRIAAGIVMASAILLAYWLYGPWLFDKAYVAFRYAKNLSSGEGFVFNPGEKVFGFSAPLYTLYLALMSLVGLPIVGTALLTGCLAGLLALAMIVHLGKEMGSEIAGWGGALLTALQFFWVALFVSGMETMVYGLLILLTLWATVKKPRWLGLACGLTLLLRYDGFIVAIVCLVYHGRRTSWASALRQSLITLGLFLPWFIFAWLYYGTPVPHSITAREASFYVTFRDEVQHLWTYIMHQKFFFPHAALALLGSWELFKLRSDWRHLPVFGALFALLFILARIPLMFHFWYMVPVIPIFLLLSVFGLWRLLAKTAALRPAERIALFVVVGLVFVAAQSLYLRQRANEYGNMASRREKNYGTTAQILQRHLHPEDRILVGEIGGLGWFLPDQHLIDGFGLVSPGVARIRKDVRTAETANGHPPTDWPMGSPSATMEIIRKFHPEFITTRDIYLHLKDLQQDPEFREQYVRLAEPMLTTIDQLTFARKDVARERKISSARPIGRVNYYEKKGRQYATIDLGSSITLTLVRIPQGHFLMGSPQDELGHFPNETRHPVWLTQDYWMGETEVTVAQFRRFVEETGYVTTGEEAGWAWGRTEDDWGKIDGATWRNPSIPQEDDHPVISISWFDAKAFAEWLAERSGLPIVLPTEAQWEYACRAGSQARYYWGDAQAGAQGNGNIAGLETREAFGWEWSFEFDDGFLWTSPVKQFRPNAFGLYDMHGNVWEWTNDWLADYPTERAVNPKGPETGEVRAIRGGSWGVRPTWIRAASRGFHLPEDSVIGLGIRVATELSPP